MVIEELIAKLGLKFSGGSDGARFLRELDKIKRATRDVGKGFDFKFGGKSGRSRHGRRRACGPSLPQDARGGRPR